jgi:molybdopterin synthase catalytic subunit
MAGTGTIHIELRDGALPRDLVSEKSAEFSTDAQVGGVASFQGIVRADQIAGGVVKAIEFSTHRSLAEKAMYQVCETAAASVRRVFLAHALGRVLVGEIAVVIVVGAVHRREAFAACQEILEQLKDEVPIFGKETTAGEEYRWKENS